MDQVTKLFSDQSGVSKRWLLGSAGKDLLDDCPVECLHLGPILLDHQGERMVRMIFHLFSFVICFFVFFSPWTNLVRPPRREDDEKDVFQLFSLVFCFLDLGPILDLEERSVRRICFYLLAKKSAVALLLQVTSVYRCLNNFLVRKISCELGR